MTRMFLYVVTAYSVHGWSRDQNHSSSPNLLVAPEEEAGVVEILKLENRGREGHLDIDEKVSGLRGFT